MAYDDDDVLVHNKNLFKTSGSSRNNIFSRRDLN